MLHCYYPGVVTASLVTELLSLTCGTPASVLAASSCLTSVTIGGRSVTRNRKTKGRAEKLYGKARESTGHKQDPAACSRLPGECRIASFALCSCYFVLRLGSTAKCRWLYGHSISHSTAIKGVIDAFLVLLNPILTAFFTTLGEVRQGVTQTMGGTAPLSGGKKRGAPCSPFPF